MSELPLLQTKDKLWHGRSEMSQHGLYSLCRKINRLHKITDWFKTKPPTHFLSFVTENKQSTVYIKENEYAINGT